MAASITGTFTIIDRASGTMRRMESQALKTMAAIEALGKAQDKSVASSRKHGAEQLKTERVLRNTARATKDSARAHGTNEAAMRRSSSATADLTGKLGRLGGALGGIGRVMMVLKFAAMAAAVAVMAQAIGTLAGGFVALIPAVAQASLAMAALPSVIASVVQGVAVFKVAFGGVSDALKAGMAVQQQSARVATDTADAHRNAAHSVASSEYNLMQAQRATGDAQIALTQARRDAIRSLTDMRLAAQGADLAQQRSGLALREARSQLAQAAVNPGTSALEMQSLSLGVREAQLAVKQARVDRGRADTDNRRAQSRGVNGNQQVIQSQRAVADAVHNVGEATYSLAESQRELNKLQTQGVPAVDQYRQALAQLGPEARHFVEHVVKLRGAFKSVRNEGAAGMFPGLDDALSSSTKAIPMARRLARRTGAVIGSETARAARRFTSGGRRRDMEGLGNLNATILQRMLRGTSNLGAALMDLMVAAEPFTDWLTHTIYLGTEWVAKWARAKRTSGEFAKSLDGTKARLKQFGGMLKDVGTIVGDVMDAAKPLGDRLWGGAADGLDNLAKKTSRSGPQMQAWFDKLYAPLHELGQLTKDLGREWLKLTVDPSFTQSVVALRKAVPGIADLLTKSAGMGPGLIGLLDSISKVLGDLPFSPLERMLGALTTILTVIDQLVSAVPGLGNAIAGILMLSLLTKSVSLTGRLLGNWRSLFRLWGGGMPGGGPGGMPGVVPGGGGGGGGAPVSVMERLFGGGRAGDTTGAGRGIGRNYRDLRAGANPLGRRAAARLAFGEVGGMGGAAMMGLRGVGKFALPVTAALGAMDFLSTQGTIGQRGQAALSGATFGLIHGPQLGTESRAIGQGKAGKVVGKGLGATNARIRELRQQLGEVRTTRTPIVGGRAAGGGGVTATHHVVTGADRKRREAELKALQGATGGMERQHASTLTGRYADIFSVYQGGNAAQRRTGRGRIAQGFQTDFREASQAGKRELSNGVAQWIAVLQKGDKSQRRAARSLTAAVKASWSDMGRHIQVVNGQVLGGSQKEWKGIARALSDPVEKARQDVSKGFTSMQKTAIGSLKAMGYNDSQAKSIIKGLEGGSAYAAMDATSGPTGAGQRRSTSDKAVAKMHGYGAKGMRIPGTGTHDNVNVTSIAAPGELIVNRHTEQRVNRFLGTYGTSLGTEVAGETRPHSAFAKGGRMGAALGHPELQPGVAQAAALVLKNFPGLSITSTTGGTHAANSWHYKGMAVDLGGTGPVMNSAAAWAGQTIGGSLTEGIHNPNLSIAGGKSVSPSTWGTKVWGDHANHIHLAVAGALGALGQGAQGNLAGGMGAGVKPIIAPKSKVKGSAGAMANASMAAIAAGLNQRIGNVAGGSSLSGDLSGFHGGGSATANMALGRRMMMAAGFGAGEWPALKALWTGESGWEATAFNKGSGATGIPQALPGSKMASAGSDWKTNPATQIAWGLDYIKGRYGSPSNAYSTWTSRSPHWYAKGGRTPEWGGWNAKGGQFNVTRPTLFGAGEAGPETVTISKGAGGGRRRPIHVNIEHIDYRREGDIKEAVARELEALVDDLDLVSTEGDED